MHSLVVEHKEDKIDEIVKTQAIEQSNQQKSQKYRIKPPMTHNRVELSLRAFTVAVFHMLDPNNKLKFFYVTFVSGGRKVSSTNSLTVMISCSF